MATRTCGGQVFLMSQTYLNIIGYHIYHKYKGIDGSRKFHQGDPGLTTLLMLMLLGFFFRFFFFFGGGGGSK